MRLLKYAQKILTGISCLTKECQGAGSRKRDWKESRSSADPAPRGTLSGDACLPAGAKDEARMGSFRVPQLCFGWNDLRCHSAFRQGERGEGQREWRPAAFLPQSTQTHLQSCWGQVGPICIGVGVENGVGSRGQQSPPSNIFCLPAFLFLVNVKYWSAPGRRVLLVSSDMVQIGDINRRGGGR